MPAENCNIGLYEHGPAAYRDYDPRASVVKDTVGPITILEIGTEVTV